MALIERWVSDKLHDVLGFSDKLIAELFVGLAKKSSSSEDLVRRLKETGAVEIDTNVTNFAGELWNKVNYISLCISKFAQNNNHFQDLSLSASLFICVKLCDNVKEICMYHMYM